MLINGVNIKSFGAILMNKTIQPATLESIYTWEKQSLLPLLLDQKFKFTLIETQLYVKGSNEEDVKSKIGAIINKAKECIIKFDDDFYYKSFLVNSPIESTLKKETRKIILSFVSYAFKEQVVETMNRITSKTINVSGNLDTPVILEVTPSIDLIDLTINGLDQDPIILKNLKANKKITVNGEDGTVTVDGVNKYGDTDMWGFPKLEPGANTITVDKSSVDINIKYKPRFI